MGLQCAWLDRTWEVKPDRVHGVDKLSFNYGMEEESGSRKKQELNISYDVYKGTGVDVEYETAIWYWYIGAVGRLYIGFNQMLAPMKLLDVDVDTELTSDGGWIASAKITLHFKEP